MQFVRRKTVPWRPLFTTSSPCRSYIFQNGTLFKPSVKSWNKSVPMWQLSFQRAIKHLGSGSLFRTNSIGPFTLFYFRRTGAGGFYCVGHVLSLCMPQYKKVMSTVSLIRTKCCWKILQGLTILGVGKKTCIAMNQPISGGSNASIRKGGIMQE